MIALALHVVSCAPSDRSTHKRSADRARRGRNNFDVARLTEVQDYRYH
jgi:hypothetical protein